MPSRLPFVQSQKENLALIIQGSNYAFKPIAEQALRPNQTIVPQRLNAALGVFTVNGTTDLLSGTELSEFLKSAIPSEIDNCHEQLRGETIVALDLGCFPWNGLLELSFLTCYEPDVVEDESPFLQIAQWRWYNFTGKAGTSCSAAHAVAARMKKAWSQASDRERLREEFLHACASALVSDETWTSLVPYEKSADFKLTVFNSDAAVLKNYCEIIGK